MAYRVKKAFQNMPQVLVDRGEPCFAAAYGLAADATTDCCKLVFIHVLTNGERVVQGLELDAAATGGFTGSKIRDTKVTANQNSNTAPFTDLDDTEIEAL